MWTLTTARGKRAVRRKPLPGPGLDDKRSGCLAVKGNREPQTCAIYIVVDVDMIKSSNDFSHLVHD